MVVRRIAALAALGLLSACSKEQEPYASLDAVYPLRQLLNESEFIVEGVLVEADPAQWTAVMEVRRTLRGGCPVPRLRMDFSTGFTSHPECLRKHLVVGAPVLFFSNGSAALAYLNRFFLFLYATGAPEKGAWGMSSIEVKMNRTFNGPETDLATLVEKILSGRSVSPPPNPNLKPIDAAAFKALPVWGEPVDEEYLPLPFRKSVPPPVVPRSPEHPSPVAPGLRWMSFEGDWSEPPKFELLKASAMGLLPDFDLSEFGEEESLRLRFNGYVDIPKDGDYAFYLSSDSDAMTSLSIGGIELVRTQRGLDATKEYGGEMALKAGKHSLTVTYAGRGADRMIRLFWFGPGIAKQQLPAKVLFHEP